MQSFGQISFDTRRGFGRVARQFNRPCLPIQSLTSLAMSSEFWSIINMWVLPLIPSWEGRTHLPFRPRS